MAMVRACVVAGVPDEERTKLVNDTMNTPHEPCKCERLRRTPVKQERRSE